MPSCYLKSSSDPYAPPAYFLRFLNQFDQGRLRLRWSQRTNQWHIERKEAASIEYIKSLPQYIRGCVNDSWIRARDGYILVSTLPALPHLGDHSISTLRFTDPWRLGARALDLQLIRQEEKKKEAQTRDFHNTVDSLAKDEFQEMIWKGGERIAVPAQGGNI